MTVPMRVILIIGSLSTILFMQRHIRNAKVQIKDSLFWLVFAVLMLLLSIFPRAAVWAAGYLQVASPINAVYLFIIFLLLILQFLSSVRISRLDARLQQLVQRQALYEKMLDEKGDTEKPAG